VFGPYFNLGFDKIIKLECLSFFCFSRENVHEILLVLKYDLILECRKLKTKSMMNRSSTTLKITVFLWLCNTVKIDMIMGKRSFF